MVYGGRGTQELSSVTIHEIIDLGWIWRERFGPSMSRHVYSLKADGSYVG